jgi:hypothetical protein
MNAVLEIATCLFGFDILVVGIRGIRRTGYTFSNCVTFSLGVLFFGCVTIWAAICLDTQTFELRNANPTENASAEVETSSNSGYANSVFMVSKLVDISFMYVVYEYTIVVFGVVALVNTFLILSFHRRLGILSTTLAEGGEDIFHWATALLIFSSIFAAVFHFLFCAEHEAFSTYAGAFQALVLIIFGAFEISELELGFSGWILIVLYCGVVSILMINLSLVSMG